MKKVICVILAFCMMCSFAGCADFLGGSLFLIFAAANDDRADKETIAAFVCEQEDALLQGIENRDFSAFEGKGFIKDIAVDNGVVEFSVNKESEHYYKVKIDTEDYRKRRKETLENLAKNIAYKVKRTKRSVALEPMNPFERRVIHSALQNDRYVTTHSEGEEPYRHVVVTLKRG